MKPTFRKHIKSILTSTNLCFLPPNKVLENATGISEGNYETGGGEQFVNGQKVVGKRCYTQNRVKCDIKGKL